MKSTLMTVFAVILLSTANAQTEAGSKFIGGNLSISGSTTTHNTSNNNEEIKENAFQLSPYFGYFIKDNLAIGAFAQFGTSGYSMRNEDPSVPNAGPDFKNKRSNLGFGVFISPFYAIVERLYFTPVISVGLGKTQSKTYNYNYDNNGNLTGGGNVTIDNTNTLRVNVTPTLVYFASPNISVNLNFGGFYFDNSKSERETDPAGTPTKNSNYGLSINGRGLTLGVNYFFGGGGSN